MKTEDEIAIELSDRVVEVSRSAIETFGVECQLMKSIEELAELGASLCRYLVDPDSLSNLASVHEELADVTIMTTQLNMIMDDESVCEVIREKLDRLESKIAEEKKGDG